MKKPFAHRFREWRSLAILASVILGVHVARAHCDTLDGPVIEAARRALAEQDPNYVLIWVGKENEPEIRRAFEQTLAVRKLSTTAADLADRSFFETLVRIHRAGEGAGFTGLQPAGGELGPAIPAADKALRDGKVDPVLNLLQSTVDKNVRKHFEAALKKRDFGKDDVETGREYVKAYVAFIHCVEALYQQATAPVQGHYTKSEAGTHTSHEK